MPESHENHAGSNKGPGRSQTTSQANSAARSRRGNTTSYHDIASSLFSTNSGDLEELFLAAARDGDSDRIQNFLQRRGDILVSVDVKDKRTGNTPIIWAAKRGHSKIVQLLLRHGADITLRNYDNHTALEVASPAIKQVLLDSIHRSGSSHQHLLQAAWQGNIEVVRKLLSEGKALDIDCRNSDGLTPLLLVTRDVYLFEKLGSKLVSSYDPLQVVQELISHRADVNAVDPEGRTPLHYTSSSKSTSANDLAGVMLQEGSSVDLRDKRCFTPIHCASQSGNVDVVLALIEHGSDPNSRGFAGATPLHITAYNGYEKVANALLQNGADVTLVDDSGRSSLDVAVSKKVKSTLKQAWVDATQVKKEAELSLGPLRASTKASSRKSAKKRGEVIFDSLVNQSGYRPTTKKLTPLTHEPSSLLTSGTIGAEWEALTISKFLNKDGPRKLGQTRSTPPQAQRVPSSLEKSPTKLLDRTLTPLDDRPLSRTHSFHGHRSASDMTADMDNPHQKLAMRRSEPVRKFAGTPLTDPHLQVTVVGLDLEESNMRVDKSSYRRFSEPQATSFSDLAASCDDVLLRGRSSVFSPEEGDSSPPPRLTPLRTPSGSDRRRMKIPETIAEGKVSSTKPVILDLDQMALSQKSGSPLFIDYSSLYPSSRVIPPTPTSQGRVSSTRLIDISSDFGSPDHSPDDSPKDGSPRSESISPCDHLIIHKENFNIEESRTQENKHPIGSNRSSLASSLSELSTPSPVYQDVPRRLSLPPMDSPRNSSARISPKTSPKTEKHAQLSSRKTLSPVKPGDSHVKDKATQPKKDINIVSSTRKVKGNSPNNGGRKEPGGKSIDHVGNSQSARLKAVAKLNAVARFANIKKTESRKHSSNSENEQSSDTKFAFDKPLTAAHNSAEKLLSASKNKIIVHSNVLVNEDTENVLETKTDTVMGSKSNNQSLNSESRTSQKPLAKGKDNRILANQEPKQTFDLASIALSVEDESKSGNNNNSPSPEFGQSSKDGAQSKPVLKRQISSTSVASSLSGSYPVKGQTEKNTSLTKVSSNVLSDHAAVTNTPRAGAMKGVTTPRKAPLQRSPTKTSPRQTPSLKQIGAIDKSMNTSNKVTKITDKTSVRGDDTPEKEKTESKPVTTMRNSVETTIKESQQTRALLDDTFLTFSEASALPSNHSKKDKHSKNSMNTDILMNAIEMLENVTKEYETVAKETKKVPSSKTSNSMVAMKSAASGNAKTKQSPVKSISASGNTSKALLSQKSSSEDLGNVASQKEVSVSSRNSAPTKLDNSNQLDKSRIVENQTSVNDKKQANVSSSQASSDGSHKKQTQTKGAALISTPKPLKQTQAKEAALTSIPKSLSTNTNAVVPPSNITLSKVIDKKTEKYSSAMDSKQVTENTPIKSTPKSPSKSTEKSSSRVDGTTDKKAVSTKTTSIKTVQEISEGIKKAVTEKKVTDRKLMKSSSNLVVKESVNKTSPKVSPTVEPKPSSISPRKPKILPAKNAESAKRESGYLTQSDGNNPANKELPNSETLTPLDASKAPAIEFSEKHQDLPKAVSINFLEHTGPVIEDVFENYPRPENTVVQNTNTSDFSSKGKSSSKQPTVFQFPNSRCREQSTNSKMKGTVRKTTKEKESESRQNSSGKRKLSNKSKEAGIKEDSKTKRPVTGKKRNVRRKKKKGEGKIHLSETADLPTTALISGIGWHIETRCNDKSDVIAVGTTDSTDDECEGVVRHTRRSGDQSDMKFKELTNEILLNPVDNEAELKLNAINKMLDSDTSANESSPAKEKKKVLSKEKKQAIREILERYRDFGGQALIPQTLHAIKEFSKQMQDSELEKLLGLDQSGDSLNTDSYRSFIWGDDSFDSIKQKIFQSEIQIYKDGRPMPESDDDYMPMSEHESEFSSSNASAGSSRQSSGQSKSCSGKKTFTDQLRELRLSGSKVREVKEEISDRNSPTDIITTPRVQIECDPENHNQTSLEEDLVTTLKDTTQESTEHDPIVASNSPKVTDSKQIFLRSLSDSWNSGSQTKTWKEKTFVELKNSPPAAHQSKEKKSKSPPIAENLDTKESSSDDKTNPELMLVHNPSEIFEKLYPGPPAVEEDPKPPQPISGNGEPAKAGNLASLPPRPKSSKLVARPSVVHHHKGSFSEVKGIESVGQLEHSREREFDELSEHPSLANSDILSVTDDVDEEVFTKNAAHAMGIASPVNSRMYTSRLGRRSTSRTGSACTQDSDYDKIIQWKKGNLLGKGAYGMVWCGLTNDGELIAVKQIELNIHNWEKAEQEYEKIQEEVDLLKNLKHKNIVGFLGTSLDDSVVSIFMQFIPGGSIATVLARFGALEEAVFSKYTKQVLEGVAYIHANNVIHRDIKGGNIMLMPNGVIKLIDFGCAKRLCLQLSVSQSEILKSMRGTPYWMAPEVVMETGHGKKSDIWSIGCTVFEMATRKPPWAELPPLTAIFSIGQDKPIPKLPGKFSEEARSFVNNCLIRDQNQRLSASELLEHPFITKRKPSSS